MCLRSGGYLWWIYSDPVFVHLHSCVFRLDPSNLRVSSSVVVAVLVCWSLGPWHDDFPTIYYNKFCPAPAREGR